MKGKETPVPVVVKKFIVNVNNQQNEMFPTEFFLQTVTFRNCVTSHCLLLSSIYLYETTSLKLIVRLYVT